MRPELTAERLRELLHYNFATGVFTRKVRTAQRHQVGDRADFEVKSGQLKGYFRVSIDSRRYLAHRVAWLYVYGVWPSDKIDHKNRNRGSNWIDNLRDVTQGVNNENISEPRSFGSSGLLGVHAHQGGWRARITTKGKTICLGVHPTKEEASAAYIAAKRLLHKGCTI